MCDQACELEVFDVKNIHYGRYRGELEDDIVKGRGQQRIFG